MRFRNLQQDFITVNDIALEACEYVIIGQSASELMTERQPLTTDKDIGIVNDANFCATEQRTETTNNADYPLELPLRAITIRLKKIRLSTICPS